MTDKEIIEVVTAHKDGKPIEGRHVTGTTDWSDCTIDPAWNFGDWDYRVKPEPPKPREWWFVKNLGSDGAARYGWTRYDVKQIGVDYLEQVHVREVLPE
jgi:hypothetical protein